MKKRFTEEQIVRLLREAEASGASIREFCRKQNVIEQMFFCWRNKYGGMDVPDARRLKALEGENAKLKRRVAEQLLVIDGLKEFAGKKGCPRRVVVLRWSRSRVGVFHSGLHVAIWA